MKQCNLCNTEIENVHPSTKYCDNCKSIATNISHKEGRAKRKDITDFDSELVNNFFYVVTEPFHLTTTGFNSVSKFSCKSYTHYYKKRWIDILCDYGVYDRLLTYVIKEYKTFIKTTNSQRIETFCDSHKYLSIRLLQSIGLDKIREECGVVKLRYTNDDYKNNFFKVKQELGHVPLFHEFVELSNIRLNSYAEKFNLKGKVYDEVIKYYVTEEDFAEYLRRRSKHKTKVGQVTGKLSRVYCDNDYEVEFNRVFQYCKDNFGIFPSRRLFNKLSIFNERSYRKNLNKTWIEVCKHYGYQIDKSHRLEKALIHFISTLTNHNFKQQVTFKWLIGIGGGYLVCDGYSKELKLVVEFDGVQHRIPVKAFGGKEAHDILKANDRIKDEEIPKHGLKILRIDSREKWYDREHLKQRLIDIGINL